MALCSIGVAVGIVAVVALASRFLFRRRLMTRAGGPGHRGLGRSFWLRTIFAKLDTTPGQEREIRSAIEDFQRETLEAKDDVKSSRNGVARAIVGEVFDESAVGEASTKVDAATARVKDAFTAALRRIHATLDPKQRERLASLLEHGPRSFFTRGGPYRGGSPFAGGIS